MTTDELLLICRTRDVTVAAAGNRLEVSGADADLDDLCPLLAARKAEVLERLTRDARRAPAPQAWTCRTCGRSTDEKRRCWVCETRPCAGCSRDTGSVFIAFCFSCQGTSVPGCE